MESVQGTVESLGPPTDKKRKVAIKLDDPNLRYPKKLQVWKTLQDGSPNPQHDLLEEAYNQGHRVNVFFEENFWTGDNGQQRKTNDVRSVELAFQATTPASAAQDNPPQATTQDSTQSSLPTSPDDPSLPVSTQTLPIDLTDLAGALEATAETLRSVAQDLRSYQPKREQPDWGDWTSPTPA